MTREERGLAEWLQDRQSSILDLIERLVNTDSGSHDKAGVDAVGDVLRSFFDQVGVYHETIPLEEQGDIIRAGVENAASGATVLLLGHRDTVFPKGEASRRPFSISRGRAHGPGVADMKSGLAMNAFVLAAFAARGGAPVPLRALFTGDEEIASPGSRAYIENEARVACAVFNAEPGRANGNVVTGRKGCAFMRCEIDGVAAHSGVNFELGASAIEELARKVQAFHALTDLEAGVTVNVGLVSGGQSVNTVAARASCEIDLRYVRPRDGAALIEEITRIGRECSVDGTRSEISVTGQFVPLVQSPESKALFDVYVAVSGALGKEVAGEFTGGCADSGFTSAVGAPTLCGVGPIGGNIHTEDEYVEIDSIVPRAQALAVSIMRLC